MNDTFSKLFRSPLLTILPPFSVALSTSYLFGYWTTFDINIFSYLSLTDLITSSAYYYIPAAILSIMLVSIIPMISIKRQMKQKKSPNFLLTALVLACLFLYALLISYFTNIRFALLFMLFTVLSFLVAFKFAISIQLRSFLPEQEIRVRIVALLIPLPLFTFLIGKINGYRVLNEKLCQYVACTTLPSVLDDDDIDKNFKFLGHISSNFFF